MIQDDFGPFTSLKGDAEFAGLISFVETRKAVIPVPAFLETGALKRAIGIDPGPLDLYARPAAYARAKERARSERIRSRP